MAEGDNIFESSIRKAVEATLGNEDGELVKHYVSQISELLMISIREMPSREYLKKLITDMIEEE